MKLITISCGLVMKEDITQPHSQTNLQGDSCGLVMKEDITQPTGYAAQKQPRCGLVMKEDITQQKKNHYLQSRVVVW